MSTRPSAVTFTLNVTSPVAPAPTVTRLKSSRRRCGSGSVAWDPGRSTFTDGTWQWYSITNTYLYAGDHSLVVDRGHGDTLTLKAKVAVPGEPLLLDTMLGAEH